LANTLPLQDSPLKARLRHMKRQFKTLQESDLIEIIGALLKRKKSFSICFAAVFIVSTVCFLLQPSRSFHRVRVRYTNHAPTVLSGSSVHFKFLSPKYRQIVYDKLSPYWNLSKAEFFTQFSNHNSPLIRIGRNDFIQQERSNGHMIAITSEGIKNGDPLQYIQDLEDILEPIIETVQNATMLQIVLNYFSLSRRLYLDYATMLEQWHEFLIEEYQKLGGSWKASRVKSRKVDESNLYSILASLKCMDTRMGTFRYYYINNSEVQKIKIHQKKLQKYMKKERANLSNAYLRMLFSGLIPNISRSEYVSSDLAFEHQLHENHSFLLPFSKKFYHEHNKYYVREAYSCVFDKYRPLNQDKYLLLPNDKKRMLVRGHLSIIENELVNEDTKNKLRKKYQEILVKFLNKDYTNAELNGALKEWPNILSLIEDQKSLLRNTTRHILNTREHQIESYHGASHILKIATSLVLALLFALLWIIGLEVKSRYQKD